MNVRQSIAHPLLLAPAGSVRAVRAALDAGADAVYVGLEGWSRGGSRGELTWSELRVAVRMAESAGRNLHLAVNIIPRTSERRQLFDQIPELLALGIRDLIVNDIGILSAMQRRFPSLRLIASVGCGAQSVADVAFLKDIGARGVVLPGTISPEEVREIRSVRDIVIEVMLHMVEEASLLGRCSMPSYLHMKPSPLPSYEGMRQSGSVKRGGVGVCFRICQQPWEMIDGGRSAGARLFPSRQISRLEDVRAYAEAGVDVLKLQGRSLPPDLLASLVRRYRDAIDAQTIPVPHQAALPAMWAVVGR